VDEVVTSENAVQGIAEILIQVSDTERSLRFYGDGLGLLFAPTGYGDGSFEAKVGQVKLLLHPDFDDSLRSITRGAGVLIHLWVPDADAYCAQLRSRGVPVLDEPADRPWGRHFSVVDPDGYRIDVLGQLKSVSASAAR